MTKKHSGYIEILLSSILWGFFPLYYKMLSHVPPMQIMLNRIIWSFVFLFIIVAISKKELFRCFESFKTFAIVTVTGISISINWFLYIFSVNNGYIIQASLACYIHPLISIILGVIFLKEKLSKSQIIALLLAAIGVLFLTVSYGEFPIISFAMAIAFGLYSLLKKISSFDPLSGLLSETFSLTPFSILIIILFQVQGTNVLFTYSRATDFLLMGAGVVTAIPLLLFGSGTKKIPLSSVGFLQYASPTISLLLGVFLYGEEFTVSHLISFAFIWLSLIVYSISIFKKR